MNKTEKSLLLLSSLSIYKGILKRSVPKAFYNLLLSADKEPVKFLSAYGDFYSLLSQRGYSDRFAYCMTEAALFDENCFTEFSAGGKTEQLPQNVVDAVIRDCKAINFVSSLSAEEILNDYKHIDKIKEIADTLPKWEKGKPAQAFADFNGDIAPLADFYRKNGCGMFARYRAFIWRDGDIQPVVHPDSIDVSSFIGYERQRNQVIENTLSFIENKSCNNCLLYGDKGTGKSSTVKAIANKFRDKGLRIVEMPKERLVDFPVLVDKIASLPMKFIIFIDDLSFQKQDQSYTSLKAVLEGGLASRPENTLIYATSNRRHLVKETWDDRNTDDINRRDNMEETLSLSDRFGLSVYFGVPQKDEFLEIVFELARKNNIKLSEQELALKAERFALSRGGRSPRCAKQFVESLFC
ncbi:MAG: ATP-binding protein [Ruminococcus sp.]|nr:ATP-binding protein [Ruminococcus sp.]